MKKLSLLCAAVLGFALNAAAINPYAYAVSAEEGAEGYTVNYSLNVDAAAVALQLFDGETLVANVPMTAITKGAHSETVALPSDLAVGTYTAKVAVTGVAHEFETYTDATISSDNRMHAFVDNVPTSAGFGNIYLAARTTASGATRRYYKVDPDYTVHTEAWAPYTTTSCGRGAMAPNGKAFFAEYGDGNSGVWVYNPATDQATQFFQGTRSSLGMFKDAGGAEVGCSTPGIAVYGTGADTKLYMIGEDFNNSDKAPFHLAIYNIGNPDGTIAETWATAPSKLVEFADGAGGNCALSGSKYGVWICQNRSKDQNTSGARSLQFYTNDGIRKYVSDENPAILNGSLGAGMVYDEPAEKLYVGNGDGNILQFSITWAADSTPTLALDTMYTLATKAIGQMSLDYAHNIVATTGAGYATSGANMRLTVFSLPAAEAPVAATPIVGFEVEVEEAPAPEITWSDFLGDGAGGGAYSNMYKVETGVAGLNFVNIQRPGWATADGIYVNVPGGISSVSVDADIDGAGALLHLSAFTQQITEVTIVYAQGSITFHVWYENGTSGPATDLENVEATEAKKFFRNGQIFIQKGNAVYTMTGVRVE